MTPPHEHWHVEPLSSAATWPIVTRDDPGVHGDRTGTHGCGTSDPALEAAATCGLASEVHSPNGGTLLWPTSVTTPAGCVADTCCPDAENVDGVVPNEQARLAPVQTCLGTTSTVPRGRHAGVTTADTVVTSR